MIDDKEYAMCPLCESEFSHIIFSKNGFYVSKCLGCGLEFQNPRVKKSDISKYYQNYAPHAEPVSSDKMRSMDVFKSYVSKKINNISLIPNIGRKSRILEIGCANGALLDELRSEGYINLYGIEMIPNKSLDSRLDKYNIVYGDCEDLIKTFPDSYFDCIIMSMVIEHLYEPKAMISFISKKLKLGGKFMLSTLVRNSIDYKVYVHGWRGYDLPRHMFYPSRRDLFILLKDFNNIQIRYQHAAIDLFKTDNELATMAMMVLAKMRLTCRVSISCNK